MALWRGNHACLVCLAGRAGPRQTACGTANATTCFVRGVYSLADLSRGVLLLCSALLSSALQLRPQPLMMNGAGYLCQQRVLCHVQTRSF